MVDPLSYFLFQPRERDVALWKEHLFVVRWVVGSILHGGPIELFLIPTSVQ